MNDKQESFGQTQGTQPVLNRIVPAGDAIGLQSRELLHAGPPLTDPRKPPPVLVSAAVMTLLHEGWVSSQSDAEKLIRDGGIQWRCAQDFSCVTPLAATISQNTPLFEVVDTAQTQAPRYSVVSPVRGADTRMGNRDPGLAERLRIRDLDIAPAWQQWLAANGPLALWPVAKAGLAEGDDLHYRTTSASQTLGSVLSLSGNANWASAIGETPTYFLTLWMAACAMLLSASGKGENAAAVVRAGGNGESFGLSLAQNEQQWVSMPATPPVGVRMPGAEDAPACPAIGDSAVVDMAGFGAQGLQWATEAREAFAGADVLPADFADIQKNIGLTTWAGDTEGRRLGIDAQAVLDCKTPPLIALAILEQTGRQGLLGRGLYRTDISLFEKALGA